MQGETMKKTISLSVLCISAIFITAGQAKAGSIRTTPGQDMKAPLMRAFGESTPPFGYVRFCAANPKECKGGARKPRRMSLSSSRWKQLNKINTYVNSSVRPATDAEIYKRAEYWTLPKNGVGDCEDYVLLKRKMLIKRGWPAESLLITVVLDQKNQGHAVLTAVTDLGDLILDNQASSIYRWNRTPYRYHKRQSQFHPSVWVALTPSSFFSTVTSSRNNNK